MIKHPVNESDQTLLRFLRSPPSPPLPCLLPSLTASVRPSLPPLPPVLSQSPEQQTLPLYIWIRIAWPITHGHVAGTITHQPIGQCPVGCGSKEKKTERKQVRDWLEGFRGSSDSSSRVRSATQGSGNNYAQSIRVGGGAVGVQQTM